MKTKAKIIVGSVCMYVGPNDERTPMSRDFKVQAGWVTADVRINSGVENTLNILGICLRNSDDIDLIIEALKTSKKLLKLKLDSEAAIAKLTSPVEGE